MSTLTYNIIPFLLRSYVAELFPLTATTHGPEQQESSTAERRIT